VVAVSEARYTGTRQIPLGQLIPFPGNAKRGNISAIRASVRAHGQYRSLVVWDCPDGLIVLAGNHTLTALRAEGHAEARCEVVQCDERTAARINLADNRLADLGDYDQEALRALIAGLEDPAPAGFSPAEVERILAAPGQSEQPQHHRPAEPPSNGPAAGGPPRPTAPSLKDRFLIPPFSVLDARSGWWRERKAQWLRAGLAPAEGRPDGLLFPHIHPGQYGPGAQAAATGLGTSQFDPVLAEIAYRWWCPPGGLVIDPFAGGPVRGLIASSLGRRYYGCDLRREQVDANRSHAARYTTGRNLPVAEPPQWDHADAADWVTALTAGSADMVLTCPPYYDLERYSGDSRDLSTMDTAAFDRALRAILHGCAQALRRDRFAVVVVGAARDTRGRLRDLRGVTVQAADAAGLGLHSEAVLITVAGSAPLRAGRGFTGTRVLARCHQDVLVFAKGSASAAARACGRVQVADATPAASD
jgi:hypothetical protein